jgi:hypothetical protein
MMDCSPRERLAHTTKNPSKLSERMLNGVAAIYGKNSMEYSKAGGSNRKRGKQSTSQVAPVVEVPTTQTAEIAIANESTNGNGKTPVR